MPRDRALDAVRARPAIRELAGNPLLLTIIAIIGMRQEIPRDRWTSTNTRPECSSGSGST